jgi:hypothetical protein
LRVSFVGIKALQKWGSDSRSQYANSQSENV